MKVAVPEGCFIDENQGFITADLRAKIMKNIFGVVTKRYGKMPKFQLLT